LNPPEDIKREAIASMLRNLHAKHAEHLVSSVWRARPDDSPQYLIDDNEIRQGFGRIIGLIAHSHWWSVSRLEKEFSRTIGAPYWCPSEWTIDPLKIACLLRVADASHIDARRAPTFLRAMRNPNAYSDEHWKFQEKLQKPHPADDALAYTSGYAFPIQDAPAWWLCLDTLTMIDRELRQVDALLADKGLQRFSARRVAGIESPERLVSYIPTDGWLPVNAFVQVSDVPRLVRMLGGEELYGADLKVSVRELIQNAADAIRARRFVEARSHDWGEIIVRLGTDEQGEWLEVDDNGIGMSSEVLTRYLLDFGTSYWGSSLMLEEFPGLLATGIKPTGKYGIGFFSVFMLGEAVRIRTRRADAAQDETLILEFNTGLSSKPILRPASREERIRDGGTCVRVWLKTPVKDEGSLLHRGGDRKPYTLERLCRKLCPSLDVNVSVQHGNRTRPVILSSDWIDGDGESFLLRVFDEEMPRFKHYDAEYLKESLSHAASNLRLLVNENGEVVGRACVAIEQFTSEERVRGARFSGAVTVGGLLACRLGGIAGILLGTSERVSRDVAEPIVSREVLAAWATDQADLVPQLYDQANAQAICAHIIRRCGGRTKKLPLAVYQDSWVSYESVAQDKSLPDEILLLDIYQIWQIETSDEKLVLNSNVILVEHSHLSAILQSSDHSDWPDYGPSWDNCSYILQRSLGGAIIEALAEAWEVSVEAILAISETNYGEKQTARTVGHIGSYEVVRGVMVIRKPS